MQERQSDNTRYWSDEMKKDFANAPHWSTEKWISVLAKRWRTEEKISILLDFELSSSIPVPSSNPRTFRKFNQSCIARQCTVTRSFYRVYLSRRKRKMIEVNSEPCYGLIPGGVSLRTGRVNPMENRDALGETPCDSSQARIAPYNNTWKRFQHTVCWCNLKHAQQRGLQFYQTRSNAVILHDTLPAEFIEKAVCMKTKDQLYQRESVILRPRVVLKPNSQSGWQDLPVQEARSSWKSQQDAESYGETRSNTADDRIPGISISTVKLQDARRQINVTKLVEMFEEHQHKEQFLEDMCQKQEINRFSEESQKLLDDMNQTEIFELFENSAEHECPDCNAYSEIGISYCGCGRNLKYSRSPTTLQKTNCEFTSIPGFAIKKNSSRGPKHGASERQVMLYKAKQMLKKARQSKHGSHPTIPSRWYDHEEYRTEPYSP